MVTTKGCALGRRWQGCHAHSHALEKLHVLLIPPAALHLAVQPAQDLVLKLRRADEDGLSLEQPLPRDHLAERGLVPIPRPCHSPGVGGSHNIPPHPAPPGAALSLTRLKLPVSRCSQSIMSKKMGMVDLRSSSSGTSVISRMGPTMPGMNSILRWPGGQGGLGADPHPRKLPCPHQQHPTATLGTVLMDISPKRPKNSPSLHSVAHRGCTTCPGWTLRSWLSCPHTCRDRGQSASFCSSECSTAQQAHPKIPDLAAWWQPGAGTRGVAGRVGWGLTWPGCCCVWQGRSSPAAGSPG